MSTLKYVFHLWSELSKRLAPSLPVSSVAPFPGSEKKVVVVGFHVPQITTGLISREYPLKSFTLSQLFFWVDQHPHITGGQVRKNVLRWLFVRCFCRFVVFSLRFSLVFWFLTSLVFWFDFLIWYLFPFTIFLVFRFDLFTFLFITQRVLGFFFGKLSKTELLFLLNFRCNFAVESVVKAKGVFYLKKLFVKPKTLPWPTWFTWPAWSPIMCACNISSLCFTAVPAKSHCWKVRQTFAFRQVLLGS